MKFESKFDIGDALFTMYNNRIKKVTINEINIIKSHTSNVYIHYKVSYLDYDIIKEFEVNEEDLFATKEEVIEDLLTPKFTFKDDIDFD